MVRGGWRWLGAYGVIVAMGAAATALAVGAYRRAVSRHRPETHAAGRAELSPPSSAPASSSACRSRRSCPTARCREAAVLQSDDRAGAGTRSRPACCGGRRAPRIGDIIALVGVMLASFTLLGGAIVRWSRRASANMRSRRRAPKIPRHSRTRRPAAFPDRPRRGVRSAARNGLLLRRDPVAGLANADADALSHSAGRAAVARL
jgi:hypothetical protein